DRHHHPGKRADPDGGLAGARPARHRHGLRRRAQERDRAAGPRRGDALCLRPAIAMRRAGRTAPRHRRRHRRRRPQVPRTRRDHRRQGAGPRGGHRHHRLRSHRHRRAGHRDRHPGASPLRRRRRRRRIRVVNQSEKTVVSEVELNFSRAEYAERLAKTRKAMEARGVELLIVTDPSNMAWLTGYDGWSFYVHQAVLVPQDGEPLWWGRGMDARGAERTVYMDHANIVGYPDNYVMSTERHPMDHLSGLIAERGFDRLAIGVEMDNYYFSAAAHASLTSHLPNARFVDATGLVNWQRAVKSEQEIAYMRRAARIVEAMHRRIIEIIAPGVRKNELVAEIYSTAIRGAEGHGGDYPAIVPMLPSGMDATAPHLTWDDKPLKADEVTFFEIAGCYKRYHC